MQIDKSLFVLKIDSYCSVQKWLTIRFGIFKTIAGFFRLEFPPPPLKYLVAAKIWYVNNIFKFIPSY